METFEVYGCARGMDPEQVKQALATHNTAHRVAWWVTSYSGGSTRLGLIGSEADLAWKLEAVAGPWQETARYALSREAR